MLVQMCKKVFSQRKFFVCLLVLLESFAAERVIFSFDNMNAEKVCVYIAGKIGIILIVLLMYRLYSWIKSTVGNCKTRIFLISFFIIFFIYLIYLALGWPGLWVGDNHMIYSYAVDFKLFATQSSITSMLFIIVLMMIPHPAAVVGFQLLVGALVGAYVIAEMYDYKKSKQIYFLIFLFISPAAVYYLFQTMRNALFAYLFLFLEVYLIKLISKDVIHSLDLLVSGLVAGILASWRGEAKIVFVIWCFILLACYKKINIRQISSAVALGFIIMLFVTFCDELAWEGGPANAKEVYSLQPFITGLSRIISTEYIKIEGEEIRDIDKVICIDDLAKHASDLAPFNWSAEIGVRSDFTREEYRQCVKSIIKVIWNNLNIYFDSKLHLVVNSTGAGIETGYLGSGHTREQTIAILQRFGKEEHVRLFMPVNRTIQETFFEILKGYYYLLPYTRLVYYFIWAIWIPIVIMFITSFTYIIKKDWIAFLISILPIAEFSMVFMLCSMESAYYFITFYLIGWVELFLLCSRKRKWVTKDEK